MLNFYDRNVGFPSRRAAIFYYSAFACINSADAVFGNLAGGMKGNDRQCTRPPVALSKFRDDLGVSETTIWRWRQKKIIRTINIFGKNYVSADCVDEFNRRAEAGEFAVSANMPKRKEEA